MTAKKIKLTYGMDAAEFSEAALQRTRMQLMLLPPGEATQRQRNRLLVDLAHIYWRQHNYPAAINAWRQVIDAARKEDDRDILGTAYTALATTYAHSGDTDNAVHFAKQGLAYSPHNVNLMYGLANAYDFAGDIDNAFRWVRRAITQDASFQMAYELLGRLHFRRGEYALAEQYLEKALELDDESTVAMNELGNMYTVMRRYQEALALFHRARRAEPHNPTAHNNIGYCYMRMGKLDEAKRWFDQRVKMKPDDALSAQIGLGLVVRSLPGANALAQSEYHFRQGIEIHKSQKARLLGSRLIEHDARRALALTGLDGAQGLAAWQEVAAQPAFGLVGPGPLSDWQIGLRLLADSPFPPTYLDEIASLIKAET
jgi:tetratricopeptide (TPR) repeat protein